MEDLLSLIDMATARYVFKMVDRRVAFLDPARPEACLAEEPADIDIGLHDKTLRKGYPGMLKKADHNHPDTVLNAVAGIHCDHALILETLQLLNGSLATTHSEDSIDTHVSFDKLILGIDLNLTTALTELRDDGMKDCRIVCDVVWGEYSGP